MIVASRAGHRQTHQATSDHIDLIVDRIVVVAKLHSDGKESQSCERGIPFGEPHLIGSDLLNEESIRRYVSIYGPNHVVAIRIGERETRETDRSPTVGIGVARDVQPMASPTLAVPRRLQ